jgi:hypothetical protein
MDDGDRRCRFHCGHERILRRGEDDIALEIDKLFGEIGNSVKRGFKNPSLDHCILTIDVPGVA